MKRYSALSLISIGLTTLCLSGCVMIYAVGPDLDRSPHPFGNSPKVKLSLSDHPRNYLDITHSPDGDKAILRTTIMGNNTYKADVSYYKFDPKLAESNAERRDYWVVAFNITQTKDRSIYLIARHPHGKVIDLKSVNEDFEILPVGCSEMQKIYPDVHTSYGEKISAPVSEVSNDALPHKKTRKQNSKVQEDQATIIVTGTPTFQDPIPGTCEFKDLAMVYEFLPKLLKQDEITRRNNLLKPDDQADSVLKWQSIRVDTRP